MSAKELKRKDSDRGKSLLGSADPELEDAFDFDNSPLPRRSGSRIGSSTSSLRTPRTFSRRSFGETVRTKLRVPGWHVPKWFCALRLAFEKPVQ